MIRVTFILSILILSVWAAPTLRSMQKESRVAIVVGNSSYADHRVPTATENALKMKKFLEKNGFYVYYGEDLGRQEFASLLKKFYKRLRPSGMGLVYYSGHAVQTKGKNYLLTVNNGISDESMIVRKSIALNAIYSGMENSYDRLNIVVLDTAFERPFGTLFEPSKSGLSAIKSPKSQVTFMASPPNAYNDSTTFTDDFLHLASEKGLELTALKTKLTALRQTHNQQTPQITITQSQPFYFVLPERLPAADELAYTKAKANSSKKELRKFIGKYPKSPYAKKAQKQLDSLVRTEAAREEKKRLKSEAKAAQRAEDAAQKEAAKREAERKNEVLFKLTKPEDVVKKRSVKPKKGEERRIHLE